MKPNPKPILGFAATIVKMWLLNLDPMREIIVERFSITGRPSNQQPEIMRLLILMADRREHNLTRWLKTVAATPLFCALIGLEPDELPGESTIRDFISRLWLGETPNRVKKLESKPDKDYGGNKMPPKRPGIIADLCRQAKVGEVFGGIPEAMLQRIFMKIALEPSKLLGLLGDPGKLRVSADGSCVLSHANPNGHKTCDCKERCDCARRYTDPEAEWGWDSYHKQYFFGYHMYALSTHNPKLKFDLPVYLSFFDAKQFDGVSLIQVLARAKHIYDGFLTFDSLIADSAHDNLPTYDLLRSFKIKPFIELNQRNGDAESKPQSILLSSNGIPVCPDGYEMVKTWFDKDKFRTKFRCPWVMGKVKDCPYRHICNKSLYGKIVYLRHAENLRLFPPVPRGSDEWIAIY